MSISKFQEKFLSQKGCSVAIAVGTCLIMSMFIFNSCAKYGNMGGNQEPGEQNQVGSVGDVPITGEQFTKALNGILGRQSQMEGKGAPPPSYGQNSTLATFALNQAINQSALTYVAQRDHIDLSDDAIVKAFQQISADRRPPGQKPDPKADQAQIDQLKKLLADPAKKAEFLDQITPELILQSVSKSIPASDDAIKHSYDSYKVKQIFIAPGPNAKSKADEAYKAVQGGMSFEAAMDKFSNDPPTGKDHKISNTSNDIPASSISSIPTYKPIDGKPAGFVSAPTDSNGGFVIYKILSIDNKAPKDLAKNMAQYKKTYVDQQASTKLQDELKKITDSSDLKWTSPGYQALYDYSKIDQNPMAQPANGSVQKIEDEAKAAAKKPGDRLAALYAWYLAENRLYSMPGADKSKMVDDRIDLLTQILQSDEDYTLRMELVDLYIQKKDGNNALANLLQASQTNTIYDVTGQNRFRDIGGKGLQLVALKLVSKSDLAKLDESQEAWKKAKKDNDTEQAQMKVEEAQEKAKAAELEKQNKAEVEKAKAMAKKGAPAQGGTTPTITGSKPTGTTGTSTATSTGTTPPPAAGH